MQNQPKFPLLEDLPKRKNQHVPLCFPQRIFMKKLSKMNGDRLPELMPNIMWSEETPIMKGLIAGYDSRLKKELANSYIILNWSLNRIVRIQEEEYMQLVKYHKSNEKANEKI